MATGPNEISNVLEAMGGPDADRRKSAKEEGMQGPRERGRFSVEVLPRDKRPIKTRFVCKIQRVADGTVGRYKARFVARGLTQGEGVEFFQCRRSVQSWVSTSCAPSLHHQPLCRVGALTC